jgi:pyridoxal 5'-phosphate synthase pdxT subunit
VSGVLACVSDYPELKVIEIRTGSDISSCDGIIIPGGESTAMRIIAENDNIFTELRRFVESGKPVWGTCAGCIILSDRVSSVLGGGSNNTSAHTSTVSASELYGASHVGGVDISTCRNFFGRQTKSFQASAKSIDDRTRKVFEDFPSIFIRAPAIIHVGDKAEALARITHDGEEVVVAAQQNNLLVTCFHPELTNDLRIHKYFLTLVQKNRM